MVALADIGLGTLFAGNAGLLQLTILPGLLAHEWQRRSGARVPVLDSLLFVFATSALASFLMVLLLQVCGLQTGLAWQVLAWVQVSAGLWICFRQRWPRPAPAQEGLHRLPLLSVLGLLVYLFCLVELLRTLIGHWPGALEGWDAIVSWNRWARDWAAGRWPFLTWGYPQLIPAGWSVLYLWLQSSEIEVFIRIWMGLFAVALMLVFLAAYVHWRRWTLLLAGAVMAGIVLLPYQHVLDSGYVDLPLSFAIALTAHWCLLAMGERSQARIWLLYATVATALAMMIKQGGLLALLMWLWTLWSLRADKRLALQAIALLAMLVLPWYLLYWWNASGNSVVDYVTRDIYGNETLRERLVRALTRTLPMVTGVAVSTKLSATVIFVGIMGLLLALRDRCGRFLALFGMSSLMGWAALFSYDGRNLLPSLPLLLLALAHGYGRLQETPPWLSDSLPLVAPTLYQPMYRIVSVLALLVLLGSALPGNVERWEHLTDRLRQLEGDLLLNQQLLNLVQQPSFMGEIYTTYPLIPAIKQLRSHWFDDHGASHMQPLTSAALQRGAPFCEVLTTIEHHERISHVLLHNTVYPGMVNAALAQGTLVEVMAVPDLKLMRVNCPASAEPAP